MALETKLRWSLYLGENEHISLMEDLLEYSHSENVHGNQESFYLPQLLQEVYYVDYLSRNANIETGIHKDRDGVYDYLRIFHARIIELLRSHYIHLTNQGQLDNNSFNKLLELSGQQVEQYVADNLQEPFRSRDAAYMIFNLLPKQYKYRLPHYARRDIISSYDKFEKYWNKGMTMLSMLQNDIHTSDVAELTKLLSELADKNSRFRNKYIGESNGCFSFTKVKKNGVSENVLCFSGQSFKGLNGAIDRIAQSRRFGNSIIIRQSMKVRYYICPERYITHADAHNSRIKHNDRMFSCCERKTFAEYNWQGVESYTMTVKYFPCELCQWSVNRHNMKYRGTIKAGVRRSPLLEKAGFDAIADEIYNEIH